MAPVMGGEGTSPKRCMQITCSACPAGRCGIGTDHMLTASARMHACTELCQQAGIMTHVGAGCLTMLKRWGHKQSIGGFARRERCYIAGSQGGLVCARAICAHAGEAMRT